LRFFYVEETIRSTLVERYNEDGLRYICVASEIDSDYQKQRVNVQVVIDHKINTNRFLDTKTGKPHYDYSTESYNV
jgi:hypothetical protein